LAHCCTLAFRPLRESRPCQRRLDADQGGRGAWSHRSSVASLRPCGPAACRHGSRDRMIYNQHRSPTPGQVRMRVSGHLTQADLRGPRCRLALEQAISTSDTLRVLVIIDILDLRRHGRRLPSGDTKLGAGALARGLGPSGRLSPILGFPV